MNGILPETKIRFTDVHMFINHLEKQENKDKVVSLNDLNYRNGKLNGNQVNQTGIETLLSRIKIPYRYANDIPEDLLAYNINRMLGENGSEKAKLRFQNGVVRAVVSEQYQPVDDLDLMREIAKRVNGTYQTKNVVVSDRFTRISVVNNDKPIEAKKDDVWYGGFDMFNSGTGFHAFLLFDYLWRMWCSNGAVSKEALSSVRHIHRGTPILKAKSRLVTCLKESGVKAKEQIIAMTEARVDKPYLNGVERRLVPVFGVKESKRFREDQLDGYSSLIKQRVRTKYDVVDVVTRKAHEFEETDFGKQRELEMIGGHLIGQIKAVA